VTKITEGPETASDGQNAIHKEGVSLPTTEDPLDAPRAEESVRGDFREPEVGDPRVGVLAQRMDVLDSQLRTVLRVLRGLDQDVKVESKSVQERLRSLTPWVRELQTQVSGLEGRMIRLELRVSALIGILRKHAVLGDMLHDIE
jgi:hypothetical protein